MDGNIFLYLFPSIWLAKWFEFSLIKYYQNEGLCLLLSQKLKDRTKNIKFWSLQNNSYLGEAKSIDIEYPVLMLLGSVIYFVTIFNSLDIRF